MLPTVEWTFRAHLTAASTNPTGRTQEDRAKVCGIVILSGAGSSRRQTSGHVCEGPSRFGKLRWEAYPEFGSTVLFVVVLDGVKRRKRAEHQHPSLPTSAWDAV